MRECHPTCPILSLSEQQIATAKQVMAAALAEIGVSPDPTDESEWNVQFDVPKVEPLAMKARELAYIAAGIPYEWVDAPSPAARGES